jgi:hypothetical protein
MSAACPVGGNLGNVGFPVLPVEGIGLDMIQAPKPEPRIMRYEFNDYKWTAIKPMLPNKPRGVRRVNDRRVLNGIFWVLRSGAAPQAANATISSALRQGGQSARTRIAVSRGLYGTDQTKSAIKRAQIKGGRAQSEAPVMRSLPGNFSAPFPSGVPQP